MIDLTCRPHVQYIEEKSDASLLFCMVELSRLRFLTFIASNHGPIWGEIWITNILCHARWSTRYKKGCICESFQFLKFIFYFNCWMRVVLLKHWSQFISFFSTGLDFLWRILWCCGVKHFLISRTARGADWGCYRRPSAPRCCAWPSGYRIWWWWCKLTW